MYSIYYYKSGFTGLRRYSKKRYKSYKVACNVAEKLKQTDKDVIYTFVLTINWAAIYPY